MSRLIDADALMEYCNNLKGKTIDANDIARFPTAVGWISVKDRLPEKDGLYLVYGMSEAMRELLPDCVPIWLCYWRRKYEGWYDIEMCRGYDFITHWMPLPEPPKGVA